MCTTSVLALPDFNKTFVLECDASGKVIGDFLMQYGRPLDFTNNQLSEHHLGQSTYEKEMLAILHAVYLWHPYILGKHFQIKYDHQRVKYFLEQKIYSLKQKKWVTKPFGYDYGIIYKKGKENMVVDSISRKYEEEGSLFSLFHCRILASRGFPRMVARPQTLKNDPNIAVGFTRFSMILMAPG
jgi:hypothetical protein